MTTWIKTIELGTGVVTWVNPAHVAAVYPGVELENGTAATIILGSQFIHLAEPTYGVLCAKLGIG